MILMLAYCITSYIVLKVRMSNAVLKKDNIYESDKVSSPFILGFIPPKIYIPFGLDDEVYQYVTEHEKCHIKRYDYYIKAFAFIMLAVHWFNPLCWLAFVLMNKDMEMSCDEWVLSHNENIKKQYSNALLSFSTGKWQKNITPLCFSESSVASRIKNILKFKKPNMLISIICILLCAAIVLACALNPKIKENIEDSVSDNISLDEVIVITPDKIIEKLNDILIKETNGVSFEKLSPDTISSVTGATYVNNDSGKYSFKYKDDITFELYSEDYGLGSIISIVYYFKGVEYAYTDENRKLMFCTEGFDGLKEELYKPFVLKNEYADYNFHAMSGTLKNESNGIFRIINTDAKFTGVEGLDSSYTRQIVYISSDKVNQSILFTFYQDLDLLAYIDNNLFFRAGDTIYRMEITYKANKVFSKEIFYVAYGQYSIVDAQRNKLILKSDSTAYLDTMTGEISTYDMASYTPEISKEEALDIALVELLKETKIPASRFENVLCELENASIISSKINKGNHPLYLVIFFDKESVSDFYKLFIDAQNGELVYFGLYGD